MTTVQPDALTRGRELVEPALRAAVDRLTDPVMRTVAGYHLGWLDTDGRPITGGSGGGKAIRPTLAMLGAEAVGAEARLAVPGAVAVELVHNFSLLHDDIMDQDIERRHRPTGWVVFGSGPAILAGNAMLTAAVQELTATDVDRRALPVLLTAVQELIRGQSEDLALERTKHVELDQVMRMEAGKTAALLACAASIGAVSAHADDSAVEHLAGFGHELGLAFQLVDDILGIVGDSSVTGKSSSSDIRAGKRSAPIVAALHSQTDAAEHLAGLLAAGPPSSEADVARAARLVDEAGGLDWARREAQAHRDAALAHLEIFGADTAPVAELTQLARYVVERDL